MNKRNKEETKYKKNVKIECDWKELIRIQKKNYSQLRIKKYRTYTRF